MRYEGVCPFIPLVTIQHTRYEGIWKAAKWDMKGCDSLGWDQGKL